MTFEPARHQSTGQFAASTQSAPGLTLGLLNEAQLSRADRVRLTAHLLEISADGRTNAEVYDSVHAVSVSRGAVYGRRGTDAKLLWTLNCADGDRIIVPTYVARAVTVTDVTDDLAVLEYGVKRARIAAERAKDERARRAGRTSGPQLGALRDKENAAAAEYRRLNAEYLRVVADRRLDELAELRDANELWTPGFEAEQDRLFDAHRAGVDLIPLAERTERAADAAVAAVAAADAAAAG